MASKVARLNSLAKDTLSGFTGHVINRSQFLNYCSRVSLQPKVGEDGKLPDAQAFDDAQVVALDSRDNVAAEKRHPLLGKVVRDSITGFQGTVVTASYSAHSAPRLTVQPPELYKGRPVECESFDEQQLVLVETGKKVKSDRTGGPGDVVRPPTIKSAVR